MVQAFFNVILGSLASIIQVVCWPTNKAINLALPNLSEKIVEVSENISLLFANGTWALGLIPKTLLITLLFILSVEIARHTIFVSTHVISLIWDIIRRIKFW